MEYYPATESQVAANGARHQHQHHYDVRGTEEFRDLHAFLFQSAVSTGRSVADCLVSPAEQSTKEISR